MTRINLKTINIPDQKRFDAFIQRLADKNLLNLSDKSLLMIQPSSEQKVTGGRDEVDALQSEQSDSTALTPFDMTPKFK